MTPRCPVNFLTLHFKSGQLVTTPSTSELEGEGLREPWVYMQCGHVFGQHSWKGLKDEDNDCRTCPICSKVGEGERERERERERARGRERWY